MVRLIPLPDPDGPIGSSRIWVNPEHITSAIAIVVHDGVHPMLYVDLKLQGLSLSRYWLATGETDELDAAWSEFLRLLGSEETSESA